jgi:catechol 2,3-dioxygenase-like lactoylglutathione lyase family enzyme
MVRLKKLGHMGIRVPDVKRSVDFYSRVFGLEVSERTEEGAVYLRCGPDHHSHVLYPAGRERLGLHHVAFEVTDPEELERAASIFERQGVPIIYGPGPGDEPGIARSLYVLDPDGNRVELYCGMQQIIRHEATSIMPTNIGHALFKMSDLAKAEHFYVDLLGLKVSDRVRGVATWLRYDPNHHGFALGQARTPGLHHTMYHVRDFGEVERAAGIVTENKLRILWGPGRHQGPGAAYFLYFYDPDGNILEVGCNMEQIWDESYQGREWELGAAVGGDFGGPAPQEFLDTLIG